MAPPVAIPLADALIWGVVTLSILVVVHEAGHFVAARLFRVTVHEFMVGLPGPALRVRLGRTAFGVTMVPLGGYVRIAGMEPGAEDSLLAAALGHVTDIGRSGAQRLAAALGVDEERAATLLATLADWGAIGPAEDDDISYLPLMSRGPGERDDALLARARSTTYRGRSTWQRITILAAGVAVNLALAIGVFTTVLAVWGYWETSLSLSAVAPGSAAERAGLRAGDTLVEFDGRKLDSFAELVQAIDRAGEGARVEITYARAEQTLSTTAVLRRVDDRVQLGITAEAKEVDPNAIEAFGLSLQATRDVFVAIAGFFRPSSFAESVSNSAGVVGISFEAARAARLGAVEYLWLLALLSLSLGALNILPIPPLDGGKVVLEVIERLRGRPLRREFSLAVSAAGALLLFSLIGYLMYADVVRYVSRG